MALIQFTYRYDHSRKERPDLCTYNQNEGYVVFSAMGSFFIPMAVMVSVIFTVKRKLDLRQKCCNLILHDILEQQ